jgi:hypothetical protein
MKEVKTNIQRAANAVVLIWLVLALEIISLISGCLQYNLLQTITNGGEISEEVVVANDSREQIIAALCLVAYLVSAVTFILWFRRAYYNLHQKADNLSFTEGWAAGSWFVPIVNLYRPYQIMRELYLKTKELLAREALVSGEKLSTDILGWWWALWIINGVVGQFIFRYSMKAETLDELIVSTVASIIGNIAGIILALVTVKMIKEYSAVEALLHEIKEEE